MHLIYSCRIHMVAQDERRGAMEYGFCLPNTMDGDELCQFAQKAEELGFESVWIGDHIVLPTAPTNQYPYTPDGSFRRPHQAPFLETLDHPRLCRSLHPQHPHRQHSRHRSIPQPYPASEDIRLARRAVQRQSRLRRRRRMAGKRVRDAGCAVLPSAAP